MGLFLRFGFVCFSSMSSRAKAAEAAYASGCELFYKGSTRSDSPDDPSATDFQSAWISSMSLGSFM
jgi:hypothetical protein